MAHFKEEEPCITVTLSFFSVFLQFIAGIFLNRCEKVTKLPKFRKKIVT